MIDPQRVAASLRLSANILDIAKLARNDAEFDNLLWHALEAYRLDLDGIRHGRQPFTVINGGAG